MSSRGSMIVTKPSAQTETDSYYRFNKYNPTGIVRNWINDTRNVSARIKAELNTKTVKDINGYGVGDGTEYNFFTSSINLPRGADIPTDFVNLIQSPTFRKLQYYAVIHSKIKTSIQEDFKSYYKLDWYSETIPSTGLDVSTAIAKRLSDINLHLSGLQIALGNINVSAVNAKVLETSEVITRTVFQIATIIPQTRIVGATGAAILQQQDLRDQLDLTVKANDINRDAKMLELEAKALIELYNAQADKPSLSRLTGDNLGDFRSTNISDDFINIGFGVFSILMLILIARRFKKTKKRK